MNPLVSVVMPTYNQEKYIKESMDSILNQTFSDFEFIILDDCSTDMTKNIVNSYKDSRIKLIEMDSKMNIPQLRNLGIQLSSGKYIANMDSDDIAELNRLELSVSVLNQSQDIDVVGGFYKMFGQSDRLVSLPTASCDIIAEMPFKCPIGNQTTLYRKSTLQKHNIRLNEAFRVCSDYMFWVSMMPTSRFFNIDQSLVNYRMHESNITQDSLKNNQKARFDVIAEIRKIALQNLGISISDEDFELYKYLIYPQTNDNLDVSHDNIKRLILELSRQVSYNPAVNDSFIKRLNVAYESFLQIKGAGVTQ